MRECELSLIDIVERLTYYHLVDEYGGVLWDRLALLLTSRAGNGHGVPAPTTRRDAATPLVETSQGSKGTLELPLRYPWHPLSTPLAPP